MGSVMLYCTRLLTLVRDCYRDLDNGVVDFFPVAVSVREYTISSSLFAFRFPAQMAPVKLATQTDLIGEEDKYSMFRMATQMPADKGYLQLHFTTRMHSSRMRTDCCSGRH